MDTIRLLNIPNYVSSYYLKGMLQVSKVVYEPNQEFKRFNNTPFLIFQYKKKTIIIDNRDPNGVHQNLYEESFLYFATNQLQNREDYNQPKVKPLFPHYPVDISGSYLKCFGRCWIRRMGLEKVLKEIYSLKKRPNYKNLRKQEVKENYIFFSGSLWKKESEANLQRAAFIEACKQHKQVAFEGGLIPRTDGDTLGFDEVLGSKRYTSKEFSEKSARSFINFSNPAVLGAVSWRIAEFWNMETFVLSLPWKVELPVFPKHGKEIHLLDNKQEFPEIIDYLIKNPRYHQQVSKGGKAYFNKYCEPKAQALRIFNEI
ncbi:hypothetical protein ACWBC2_08730 [Salegentibacter agarivorans]